MFLFGDQVEHAHDNPLDEITLGECDTTVTMRLDDMSSEKPVTPKRMNLDADKDPEDTCDMENDSQAQGEKTEKKEVAKEKAKRGSYAKLYFDVNAYQCGLRFVCVCT